CAREPHFFYSSGYYGQYFEFW
nr:immunoglobulin heavy chain junction region [Macaca mulatta]MOV92155.1 immunoglobulin heavy chain junction region [Macaca mulatta]